MQTEFREYLKYIKYQRNYSAKTVTAYQNDLLQFESFLQDVFNHNKITWSYVNKNIIRQFLAILNTSGLQKRNFLREFFICKAFSRLYNPFHPCFRQVSS